MIRFGVAIQVIFKPQMVIFGRSSGIRSGQSEHQVIFAAEINSGKQGISAEVNQ